MKRIVDIILAGGALIFLSPILVLIAVTLQLFDPPAFVLVRERLKFRPWPLLRRFSMDDLPALLDILLGRQSFFDQVTRQLFRSESVPTFDHDRSRGAIVWILILAALLALVWSLSYA